MKEEKSFLSDYKEQIQEAISDLKTKGRRHKQIPNILTLLRLTAPLVIIPAAFVANVPFIIGATAFFGLTDLADGFIARNWELTSKLGADLDALADKLFAGTLLLAASVTNPLLLVNAGLEVAIAGININQKAKGNEPASTLMGKAKTFALFALAGVGILSSTFPAKVLNGLMATTTGMQALTIGSYLKKYKKDEAKIEAKTEEEKGNPNSIEVKIEPQVKEKVKELGKEKPQSTKELDNVQELKQMRELLLSQKTIYKPTIKEGPKVYYKKR